MVIRENYYEKLNEAYESGISDARKNHVSNFKYKNGDTDITANIDSSHIACVCAGLVIGAAVGIYIYKNYFNK